MLLPGGMLGGVAEALSVGSRENQIEIVAGEHPYGKKV
jgi:hypothetical protein